MGKHYLAQHYLRGFAELDRFWAYDKAQNRSLRTQPKSIANERDIYSDELESHLANEVEGPASPIIDKIRAGGSLDAQEKRTLARYVLVLWKRVPRARERAAQLLPGLSEKYRKDLTNDFAMLRKNYPHLEGRIAKREAEVDPIIARLIANPPPAIWQLGIDTPSPQIIDIMCSMRWVYLRVRGQQLLTCDNPVFFFEHEGVGNEESELTLPVSSSVALWLSRTRGPSDVFIDASRQAIKQINRRTAFNCTRFAFAAREEEWILPFLLKDGWPLTRLL